MLVPILAATRAGAQAGDFAACFQGDPEFACFSVRSECVSWLGGYREGSPPPIRLSRGPFARLDDPADRDLDEDHLRDDVELEIARAIAPYAVNAWAVHGFQGEPDLGEPTALFQVRPYVRGGAEPVSPVSRAIVVRFALLWDWDHGYLSGDACHLGAGYTWHEGDDQGYEFVLDMVADDPLFGSDPTLWRIRDPAGLDVSWWHMPGAAEDAVEVEHLHPVLFFSHGKHHQTSSPCWDCALHGCEERLICPLASDFAVEEAAGLRFLSYWHRWTGRNLVPVDGNAAMTRNDGWVGYEGPVLPLGNNVGEPGRHLIDDLGAFCVYRDSIWPEDLGAPGTQHCFADEFAWDDREFWGGHCVWCDDTRRNRVLGSDPSDPHLYLRHTSPLQELWSWEDISDVDGDGLVGDVDRCYLLPAGARGPWPVAVDADLDTMVDECDACPRHPGATEFHDADGDGIWDGCDLCPDDWGWPAEDAAPPPGTSHSYDADADGIGDRCDLCPHRSRTGTGSVRSSAQYNRSVGDAGPGDSDGDGIGDDCDLCPFLRHAGPEHYFFEEIDWVYRNPESGLWRFYDEDGDIVGDRCDNCRKMPNRDQANCNLDDERRAGPSVMPIRGDACDAMPCIDRCMVPLTGLAVPDPTLDIARLPIFASVFFRGYHTTEPLTARFCAVGGDVGRVDPTTEVPESTNIPTQVQGCLCTMGERAYCRESFGPCRQAGAPGGRWASIDYRGGGIDGPNPVYEFTPLYDNDGSGGGLDGRRYELDGYRAWYRTALAERTRRQP
jgi:hypothetical protein